MLYVATNFIYSFQCYEYTFAEQASDTYCMSITRIFYVSPFITPQNLSFHNSICSHSYIVIVITTRVSIIVCRL